MNDKPKARGGFAHMHPDKLREIARMGGKSVPNDKRGFAVNKAAAVEAGRKGGNSPKKPREKLTAPVE